MSENVTLGPKTGSCDNVVQFPTLTLLSELGSTVPMRSGFVPFVGPATYAREVRWADSIFPGQRLLLVYDNDGTVAKCEFIAEQYADEKSEDAAWTWLNDHIPKPPQLEAQQRNEQRPEPTDYPALRLI
jgi:hypothetical protein